MRHEFTKRGSHTGKYELLVDDDTEGEQIDGDYVAHLFIFCFVFLVRYRKCCYVSRKSKACFFYICSATFFKDCLDSVMYIMNTVVALAIVFENLDETFNG